MFTIVYASLASTPFSNAELLKWLPAFREKNARLGVTGLLLYQDGAFMQALEGAEPTVRELFAVIRADARHHQVVTLLSGPVSERRFPDWSMGFAIGEANAGLKVPGYDSFLEVRRSGDELPWKGSIAMCLLATFKLKLNEGLSAGQPTFIPGPRRPRC